jgi:hypothetical protein
MATLLTGIFTLDIGGNPILTFEAKNLPRGMGVLSRSLANIERLQSNALPLWDGKAPFGALCVAIGNRAAPAGYNGRGS